MTRFEESIAKYKTNPDLYELLLFVKDGLTTQQCKSAIAISDDNDFIQYLICVYGCYCIPRKKCVPHLIRNPQALSLSENERKELVDIIKNTIAHEIETIKAIQKAHQIHSKK